MATRQTWVGVSQKGVARIMYLGFFQSGIYTWFEISKVTEDALFELLHVSDGSPKGLESKDQSANDVCSSDMIGA